MSVFKPDQIQIGISACLLGEQVRFDGGHKQSRYCMDELSRVFHYVPVCPEMAIGMGTPRKTIRLVNYSGEVRVQASDDSFDVTEQLIDYATEKSAELNFLSGYIVCAKSPTCGMERVRLYDGKTGYSEKAGVGVFARRLMETYPLLPIEEDGRLYDLVLRENFITRVFAYHDWHKLLAEGLSRKAIVAFHTRYKYLLMAHHQEQYRQLGRLVANFTDDLDKDAQNYFTLFMQTLMHHANRRSHTNVLQHIQGFFSDRLTARQKQELKGSIDKYREGLLPLLVPVTLIRHYLNEFEEPFVDQQVYLNPHPEELKLRYGY
ncbi:YbgA family protein [Nitrincola sp.]|uniref:YbgA family protein n=1 Tax=Nitrincola sp. TaxID=1926584 RepID=UPI003A93B74B